MTEQQKAMRELQRLGQEFDAANPLPISQADRSLLAVLNITIRDEDALSAIAQFRFSTTEALEESNRVLTAENKRLRAALEPFQRVATNFAVEGEGRSVRATVVGEECTRWAILSTDDFLTARSALHPIEQGDLK